jgi:hypothetical protein
VTNMQQTHEDMLLIIQRDNVPKLIVRLSSFALVGLICSGCSSNPTSTISSSTVQMQRSGLFTPTEAQQAAVIQGMETDPKIPDSERQQVIARYKQDEGAVASTAQSNGPSLSEQDKVIQSIQNNPNMTADQKASQITQFKQQMQSVGGH